MQASLFSDSNMVKGAAAHDARQAARKAEDKKKREQEMSNRKRKSGRKRKATIKVSRGNKLKRHPSRPPKKKRVVSTKKVAMRGHEDGPLGDIINREGSTLYIQWPGKDRLMSHNAMYMVSVEVKDAD